MQNEEKQKLGTQAMSASYHDTLLYHLSADITVVLQDGSCRTHDKADYFVITVGTLTIFMSPARVAELHDKLAEGLKKVR